MNAHSRVEQARQIIRRALDEAPHATVCAARGRSEACNCWRFQATRFLLDLGHDAVEAHRERLLEVRTICPHCLGERKSGSGPCDCRPSREQGEHPL